MPWHVCGTHESSSGTSWRSSQNSTSVCTVGTPPADGGPTSAGGEAYAPALKLSVSPQRSPVSDGAQASTWPSWVPVAAVLIAMWDRATVTVSRGRDPFGVDPGRSVDFTNPLGITYLYFTKSRTRWRSGGFRSYLSISLGGEMPPRYGRVTLRQSCCFAEDRHQSTCICAGEPPPRRSWRAAGWRGCQELSSPALSACCLCRRKPTSLQGAGSAAARQRCRWPGHLPLLETMTTRQHRARNT